jgi:hypothetical protein
MVMKSVSSKKATASKAAASRPTTKDMIVQAIVNLVRAYFFPGQRFRAMRKERLRCHLL